jgi:hypothetical protein
MSDAFSDEYNRTRNVTNQDSMAITGTSVSFEIYYGISRLLHGLDMGRIGRQEMQAGTGKGRGGGGRGQSTKFSLGLVLFEMLLRSSGEWWHGSWACA